MLLYRKEEKWSEGNYGSILQKRNWWKNGGKRAGKRRNKKRESNKKTKGRKWRKEKRAKKAGKEKGKIAHPDSSLTHEAVFPRPQVSREAERRGHSEFVYFSDFCVTKAVIWRSLVPVESRKEPGRGWPSNISLVSIRSDLMEKLEWARKRAVIGLHAVAILY